ncbi:hypothetical protein F4776DRAFT_465562 [Hypoxylon sp. NC0597]|nr:hypothetical protein F4776DRAFT_465562 [Hypoxylon sp. NC0597]
MSGHYSSFPSFPAYFHRPLLPQNHFINSSVSHSHFLCSLINTVHLHFNSLITCSFRSVTNNLNPPVLPTCCPHAGLLILSRSHFIIVFSTYPLTPLIPLSLYPLNMGKCLQLLPS